MEARWKYDRGRCFCNFPILLQVSQISILYSQLRFTLTSHVSSRSLLQLFVDFNFFGGGHGFMLVSQIAL